MTKTVEEHVEELSAPKTFDFLGALSKTTYPKEDVTVFLDGDKAKLLEDAIQDKANVDQEIAQLQSIGTQGIVEEPQITEAKERASVLEEDIKRIIDEIRGSALTFSLKGLAPEQWRLIVKSWRRKVKPVSKAEDDVIDADEERAIKINAEILATSTLRVTNAQGEVNDTALTVEQVEALNDKLESSEFDRLINVANKLTFARGQFATLIAQDADFLSKDS